MNSDLAKVSHKIEGVTLLGHVLSTASKLPVEQSVVVVGHQAEDVRAAHARFGPIFVTQEPQLGTGHAVQQARSALSDPDGETLVLYGDVPLLRRSTLLELMEEHLRAENAVTVLTARVADPAGYGRIIRGKDGSLVAIVEDRDLTEDQRSIDEINSGIYAFRTMHLLEALEELRNDNEQEEYYLTDTVQSLRKRRLPVGTYVLSDPLEISGINTPQQLAEAEAVLKGRQEAGTADCTICDLSHLRSDGYPLLMSMQEAFLAIDTRPYNSGQLIVHPRRHLIQHSSLREEERTELWKLAQVAAQVLEGEYNPEGMNLGYASGEPGEHLGLRVIPRWAGDTNFMPLVAGKTLLPERPLETHARIRKALAEKGCRD